MTHVLNSPKLLIKLHNLRKKNEWLQYTISKTENGKQVNSRAVLLYFKIRERKNVFRPQISASKGGNFCMDSPQFAKV